MKQMIKESDIAIIGLGFRIPGDNNEPNELFNNLKSGFDAVTEFQSERWSKNYSNLGDMNSNKAALLNFDDWKNFDALFFGISPSEVATIDPQQRLSLISTWEALEDAYLDPIQLRGSNTSVFMGSYASDYLFGLKDRVHFSNTINSNFHCLANRISYCFDFKGQSVSVDTACSASSNAIISGIQTLVSGASNISICGGTNFIIDTLFSKSLTIAGMDSRTGNSKSFDASADGFARSEGCGIVVMKKLSQAITDGNKIYCIIKGYGSNSDGNSTDKSNFLSPSINGQLLNIENSFKSTLGTVPPSDIFYVEAHGTGTPVGDPIELKAISIALKTSTSRSSTSPLLVGSLKSNIGHMEAASGVASLIKCCLLFKHRTLTPNIHFNNPNPRINFKDWNIKVVTKETPFPSDKQVSILINNFGATGSNTCFILSEYIKNVDINKFGTRDNEHQFLIPFSSNSKKSLDQYQSLIVNNYVGKMEFNEFLIRQIFTKTTQLGQRSVVCSKSDWSGFKDNSNQKYYTVSNKSSNIVSTLIEPTIVFIFPGQGPQFNRMAVELYEKEQIFRESMNEINELFKSYYGHSILNKLRSIDDDDIHSIHIPTLVQPSMMMVQISLFKLLKYHWNINPSFIIGHSLGEIPAAYCSGMIDLETCIKIVYARSISQDRLVGSGKMLSITITKEEYNSNYLANYPFVEIACYNSSNSIVVSGNEHDLIDLSNQLKSKSIPFTFLASNVAYHSSVLLSIKDEMISTIGDFGIKQPTTPIFSSCSGELFNKDSQIFSANYIYKSSREPVYFKKSIDNLFQYIEANNIGNGAVTFIEISPHPVLSYYLNELIPQNSNYFNKDTISILPTLNRKKNDIREINKTISQLYCQGCNVNFKSQLYNKCRDDITGIDIYSKLSSFDLPRYQWDFQSFWLESDESYKHRVEGPPITILGNSNHLTSPFESRTTYINISKEPFQWLKGHVVKDKGGVGKNNIYFPGAGYIDNILNIYKNQDLIIENMEFKLPFILVEGKNLPLTTNITQISPNQVKAVFHIRDQKSNEWIQTSNSNISVYNKPIIDCGVTFSIEALKEQHNYSYLLKSEFYDHIKRIASINYGGCFQRVEECWIGENNSALIKVSTKKLISKNDNEMFLNASIIDCCFHGMFSTIKDPCVIVFERIENLKIYSSNIPPASSKTYDYDDTFIYVLSKTNKSRDSFYGSIFAFLEDGSVLFESNEVVCTSTVPVINSILPEYPNDDFYSFYLEPKDAPIPNVNSFQHFYNGIQQQDDIEYFKMLISNLLYKYISNRSNKITIESITNNSIDQLMGIHLTRLNSRYSRLLKFVFETLKSNKLDCSGVSDFAIDGSNSFALVISKSTKIIAKLLFPLVDDDPSTDIPHSLLKDGLLDNLYSKTNIENNLLVISNVISSSIKLQLKERIVFRVLELGGGTASLSENVLNSINQLFNENTNPKILIEFTFTDKSQSIIADAKIKLSNLLSVVNRNNISILFKTFDLEISHSSQSFKPSYYDFIIFSNVLHVVKDISFGLDQIDQLLKPNGHLLFMEVAPNIVADSIFGCFDQWWSFTDTQIRPDRCCLDKEAWVKLLSKCGFTNHMVSNFNDKITPFIIHTQKKQLLSSTPPTAKSAYNIIIYTGGKQSESINRFIKLISNQIFSNSNSKISIVTTVDEFKNQNIPNNDKSLIFFVSTIEPLDINNYCGISTELFLIGKHLVDNDKKECKTSVISLNSQCESTNYLNSSVLGVMKYFEDSPISVYSFDYDQESILNDNTVLSTINSLLLNSKQHIQIEYIIRNNNVYYQRVYRESINNGNNNNPDEMLVKLNSLLEYELEGKSKLKNDEIEIKVISTGINIKDNLNYKGLIPTEILNWDNNNGNGHQDDGQLGYGYECSGVVSRIGSDVTSFKVGDCVFGLSNTTTSSHIIIKENSNCIILKPYNINHSSAASIPFVYLTSYYSLFKIGNLDIEDSEKSVLIHDASSDIGLSALNILQWKGYKSNIFVTVDSIEKEQYLYDNYGDFITGIYHSNNFFEKIKLKLKQLGTNKKGIDLIINTLSIDYLDSNFKSLCYCGKIVDLSIAHLNQNHVTTFKRFNNFIGYQAFDVSHLPFKKSKPLLNEIGSAITNGSLKLIKTNNYSILKIKDVIESFNNQQIGKIVVEMDSDIISPLITSPSHTVPSISKFDYKLNGLGKTILVTGQTGIILEILKWVVSYSSVVENIIVLSYSKLKWGLKLLINQTMGSKANKFKFYFKSVDVSNEKLLNETIDQIYSQYKHLTSVDTIFHFAFQHTPTIIDKVDLKDFEISHSAKTVGTINLHKIAMKRNWDLKNFVLSSSIASVMYHSGSPTYVSANNVLDAFSRYRKSIGLPCTTLNLGLVTSTGVLEHSNKSTIDILDSYGITPIKTNLIFGALDLLLGGGHNKYSDGGNLIQSLAYNNSMICRFNFNISNTYLKSIRFSYKFDYYTNQIVEQTSKTSGKELDSSEFLINSISDLLSIEPSLINHDFKLSDYGADSLHSTILKNKIDKQFPESTITIAHIQSMKIKSIIQTVIKYANQNNGPQKQKEMDESLSPDRSKYWENECNFNTEIIKYKQDTIATPTTMELIESPNIKHNVLLTGVTGFFGVYLLYHLIQLDSCLIVHCPVRNKNSEIESLQSIINNLKYHELYDSLNQHQLNKINPLIVSDLSDNNFGLSNKLNYQVLSESVNLIIHNAANISVTANYEESKQSNIGSLKQLIKFAFNKQIKRFVHFSTMALFFDDTTLKSDFDESVWPSLSNINNLGGYRQCKVVGEYILKDAFKHGLPSTLIRLPSISSNSNTGIGRKNDIYQLLIQSCFIEKCYYRSSDYIVHSPVDWVSKSTMKLIFNNSSWSHNNEITVYNLYSDSISLTSLFEMIGLLKSSEFDYEAWESIIKKSKNECCIRYNTFCPGQSPMLKENIKLSQKTKTILSNNNTLDISGGILKKYMMENHLYFNFKK